MVKQTRFTIPSLFLFFLLGLTLSAQAQTILHVNRTDPTCGGQVPCFSSIQAAVNAADPGNVIQIQAGTYCLMGSGTRPRVVSSAFGIVHCCGTLQR